MQLVHGESYVTQFCDGSLDEKAKRRIGLPWSEGLVKRTCTAVGGTVLTVQLALMIWRSPKALLRRSHLFID